MTPKHSLSEGEEDLVRDYIHLLLRISRAGSRNGWSTELTDVWDHAAAMAREVGIPEATIREIRAPGLRFVGMGLDD